MHILYNLQLIQYSVNLIVFVKLEFAVSATTIPLSIFTNLFHQRFSKHDYLESTLEILQQFYIKMHSDHKHYCIIPGDLCKYTLKCGRCDTSITPPGTIGVTLYHAPVAILRHLEMIDDEDHPSNPPGVFDLSHVPVLFSGMDTFGSAQASFQKTLTNISDNDRDRLFCSKVNGAKKGEEEFCEAVKVDVSKTKETHFQASITNSVALVRVLFEDFGVAVEILEKATKYQHMSKYSDTEYFRQPIYIGIQ